MAERRTEALVVLGAAAAGAGILRRGISAQVVGRFARVALRKGVRGGSRPWLYVGATATALQLLQRVTRPRPEIFRTRLRPGQRIEIVHRARPAR